MRKCLTLLVVLSGCGDNYVPYEAEPPINRTVYLTSQDARISDVDILRGCAYWRPVGVECLTGSGRGIRVGVDDGDCPMWGRHALAWASAGWITVRLDCLDDGDLVPVLAHEIGHHLGMWGHTENGLALMNSTFTPLPTITIYDKELYDAR